MVKFNVDWTRRRCWSIGFGATWRQTDYKDLYYGRNDDTRSSTTYR